MSRKQLIGLVVTYLVPFLVGNSLLVLLPLHMQALGAEAGATGFYLALAFGALAVGTLSGGWISQTFQRRKPTDKQGDIPVLRQVRPSAGGNFIPGPYPQFILQGKAKLIGLSV